MCQPLFGALLQKILAVISLVPSGLFLLKMLLLCKEDFKSRLALLVKRLAGCGLQATQVHLPQLALDELSSRPSKSPGTYILLLLLSILGTQRFTTTAIAVHPPMIHHHPWTRRALCQADASHLPTLHFIPRTVVSPTGQQLPWLLE